MNPNAVARVVHPIGFFIDWDGFARRTEAPGSGFTCIQVGDASLEVIDSDGFVVHECSFFSSMDEVRAICAPNDVHLISEFTLYWMHGKREVIMGANIQDAMNRDAGDDGIRVLAFYTNGDDCSHDFVSGKWVTRDFSSDAAK